MLGKSDDDRMGDASRPDDRNLDTFAALNRENGAIAVV